MQATPTGELTRQILEFDIETDGGDQPRDCTSALVPVSQLRVSRQCADRSVFMCCGPE